MVPVINVPIDLRACAGPPGQGGWMGGKASFVQQENYRKYHAKIKDSELEIRTALSKLYMQSPNKFFSQEDTFEHDMDALNKLYNLYKASATERMASLQPPQRQIPTTPTVRATKPTPAVAAPKWYVAQDERFYIRRDYPFENQQYEKVTGTGPFFLYHVPGKVQPEISTNATKPSNATKVDGVEYFLYQKKYPRTYE